MFMILPTAHTDTINEESPDATRTRVKKACNRCRIKKSKCNGRIPCARCERDKVVCRSDRGPLDNKELSRSYIASLEYQQLSLLSALRDLNRQFPNERRIRGILEQLQASGFDVGSLEPQDPSFQDNTMTYGNGGSKETIGGIMGNGSGLMTDDTGLFDLESLLARPDPLDSQTVADFLSLNGDQSLPQNSGEEILFNNTYTDNTLVDAVAADPTAFTLGGGSAGQQQPHNLQDFGTGIDHSWDLS